MIQRILLITNTVVICDQCSNASVGLLSAMYMLRLLPVLHRVRKKTNSLP